MKIYLTLPDRISEIIIVKCKSEIIANIFIVFLAMEVLLPSIL
jgi:hypothetical protein